MFDTNDNYTAINLEFDYLNLRKYLLKRDIQFRCQHKNSKIC